MGKREPRPLRDVWIVWLIGPGTFGAWLLLTHLFPRRVSDPPDFDLTSLLGLTQLFAALATVSMLFLRHYRRLPEFWLLFAYWISLTGSFVLILDASRRLDPSASKGVPSLEWVVVCLNCSAALATAIPLAGLVRLCRRRSRRP